MQQPAYRIAAAGGSGALGNDFWIIEPAFGIRRWPRVRTAARAFLNGRGEVLENAEDGIRVRSLMPSR